MSETKLITYVGLDVHKNLTNVALIKPESSEVDVEWQIATDKRSIRSLVRKLQKLGSHWIRICYEAGPCGYALQRQLIDAGVECVVVAPALIPVKAGDRIKTDTRDARKLAELFKAGLLTEVHPPTLEDEAVRDLTRAREAANRDLLSARHRVSKMLQRQGFIYRQGTNWTQRHWAWVKSIRLPEAYSQVVLDNYILSVEQITERLEQLTHHIEELSQTDRYVELAGWLRCLRGVDTIVAMTVLAELHDPCRFHNARELMAYLGLVPSEHSSGGRTSRGSITKTGNSHVRRVLVEASWSYRHRPSVGACLKKRRHGQPAEVIAIADRAQSRLYKRYHRMKEGQKKHSNVVTTAVARELTGFIWAILQHQKAA